VFGKINDVHQTHLADKTNGPTLLLLNHASISNYLLIAILPQTVGIRPDGEYPVGKSGDGRVPNQLQREDGTAAASSNALLWAGCGGGSDLEGWMLVGGNRAVDTTWWGDADDEICSPVITNPGAYRGMSIELDLHNLAIAARRIARRMHK